MAGEGDGLARMRDNTTFSVVEGDVAALVRVLPGLFVMLLCSYVLHKSLIHCSTASDLQQLSNTVRFILEGSTSQSAFQPFLGSLCFRQI